jgi:hypothetical protein
LNLPKIKSEPEGKPRQFWTKPTPSGSSQADVTVETSVGEVFVTEDQGSPHESTFVPSNSIDAVHTIPGASKPLDSIENSVGFGITHQVKEKIIKGEYVEMNSLLEKNQNENGEQTVSVVNGELVIKIVKPRVKLNKFKTVILNIHLFR